MLIDYNLSHEKGSRYTSLIVLSCFARRLHGGIYPALLCCKMGRTQVIISPQYAGINTAMLVCQARLIQMPMIFPILPITAPQALP